MNKLSVALSAAALSLLGSTANATIIGSAVNLAGTTIDGGSLANPIDFYIPLSSNASGIYGTGNIGRSSDTCSTAWTSSDRCGGGSLGMLLQFSGAAAGSHLMTLQFNDLDLAGVNDPYYFFENVSIFALNSTPSFDFVWNSNNPLVTFANHNDQILEIGIDYFSGGDLYFGLLFGSNIYASGTFYNTPETLIASLDQVVSVPEPATLSMLGAGLLLLGFAKRRNSKNAWPSRDESRRI